MLGLGCWGNPGSSTLHVLGLGQHELEAVLLVDTLIFPGSTADAVTDSSAGSSIQVNYFTLGCGF